MISKKESKTISQMIKPDFSWSHALGKPSDVDAGVSVKRLTTHFLWKRQIQDGYRTIFYSYIKKLKLKKNSKRKDMTDP